MESQLPKSPPEQKPDWMSEEDWQEHVEEVRAFEKRVFKQSGGRLVGNYYPISQPKQRWSLLSSLFGPRDKGRS